MTPLRSALLVLIASLLGGFLFSSLKPKDVKLDKFGKAPSFSLTDSQGQSFNSAALNGKVWVVNFFFSSCEGICPAMNGRLAKIYRENLNNDNFRVVSITIDPETDTPAVLAQYAKRFEANPNRWFFLTGSFDQIRQIVADGFKLVTPEDKNLHTTRIVLVDRSGEIRGFYQGTEDESVAKLRKDMESLL